MKYKVLLAFIISLAFILRFWQLGNNPPSLDWDEASLGYNAYSLLKTGKDEYGASWPLSIRSFNDYKPPLYTYLTIIPVALFGLNEFSTRFISALFGFLAVIIGYFLIKELFPKKSSVFYLLFTVFFSLSPWHIQFSRVAFETNTALFFFILGIWLFLKGLKNSKYCLFSFLSFGLSVYAYHSPRLVVPILLLGIFAIYFKEIKKKIWWFIFSFMIFVFMLIPLIQEFRTSTIARFGSVTVISPNERLGSSIEAMKFDKERGDVLGKLMHNRRIIYAREILSGYLDHFNFDFLFLNGDASGRHHAVGMGMLYLWDLPFMLVGLFYLLQNRNERVYILLYWFLIAPISSSLTKATPHAVRSLLYLPTFQIFTAIGLFEIIQHLKVHSKKIVQITAVFFTFIFFVINFFYYLHMYWIHTPYEEAKWWQYGYKQVVEEVAKLEQNYNKVIVTYYYDQPYIYFLFYNRIDPSWYQTNWGEGEIKRAERKFGNYEFRNIDWEKDAHLTNTLLVGSPDEIPKDAAGLIKEISFPDGTVAFRIVGR